MSRSIAASASRRAALPRSSQHPGVGILRPFTFAARLMQASIAFAWERRRLRFALLALLATLVLLGGGWLWLRHSSLTAVEHVQLSGVSAHGYEAGAINAALLDAARQMSTLDVKPAALRAAVAPFPIVRSVRARASFPHGLRVEVVEQPPVAVLVIGPVRTAVAADGVVLGSGSVSSSLPVVSASAAAGAEAPPVGRRVHGGMLLRELAVLGVAPAPLAKVITRTYSGPEGVTVVLKGGLLAYFGDATRPNAKWLSLVRVLADQSSAGAAYIDVRLPERPAAGFASGTARPYASSTALGPGSVSSPTTAAELAAGLDAAVGGGSSTPLEPATSASLP